MSTADSMPSRYWSSLRLQIMSVLKTTFSIRTLFCIATLAGFVMFFFTFERTASLTLPATTSGKLDVGKLRALESETVLERVVVTTSQNMLPRPLRGKAPDYAWFRQNLSVRPNPETNEIDVEISTNLATAEQLKQFLEQLSKFRVETRMPTASSRLDRYANWISNAKESIYKRAQNQLRDAGNRIIRLRD